MSVRSYIGVMPCNDEDPLLLCSIYDKCLNDVKERKQIDSPYNNSSMSRTKGGTMSVPSYMA
jgi:hypothetical protein